MTGYTGENAQNYRQTPNKLVYLIPAVRRLLPQARTGGRLLDVACGNGDFFVIAREKGYEYYGLDASAEILERAKKDYPGGNYLRASATDFASQYREKFDVVLISMLLPIFGTKEDIIKTLLESKSVLKENGTILIGIPHPAWDSYMRKGIFDNPDVETDFRGYFASGQRYLVRKRFDNPDNIVEFEDYHWPLSDYVECLTQAGLVITAVDECPPDMSLPDASKIKDLLLYPRFMVILCRSTT